MTTPNKSREQTAKALGIDASNLRRMYRGKGYPNHINCLEIARITGIDAQSVLAYVGADKAKTEEKRALALQRLPRLLPTIGFTFAAIVGATLLVGGRNLKDADFAQSDRGGTYPAIHYAQMTGGLTRKLFYALVLLLGLGAAPRTREIAAAQILRTR